MGKLRMQPMSNEKSRRKQLDKRMKSLDKAAKDLSTLCGVDVGMIVYAPALQPIATGWPPDNQQQVLEGLIESYKDTSRNNKTYNLSNFFKDKAEKIEDEIKKLLESDGGGLMAKLDDVRRRINLMKGSNNRLPTESSSSSDHVLKAFYSTNYSVDQESGGFGPSMSNYEEPPFVQESGGFGPSMSNYEEPPFVQESGGFGPSMSNYEEPPVDQERGVFGPSMSNYEEPPVDQERGVFGPSMSNYEEPPVDQERGVFGPSMWNYEEPPVDRESGVFGLQDLVYYSCGSDQANENKDHTDNIDQLMMMSYGVSNGMYEFEENIVPTSDQPLMSYNNNDVQNIETTWPRSFDIVPIDEQMPSDMECFSSSINAGGGSEDDQILSAKEWFLNEEAFFNDMLEI